VPDVPAPLAWLTDRLSRLIATATDSLEAQYPDGVDAWQQEVSRQLARYHGAAMLASSGVPTLTPAMETAVTTDLAAQLRFLEKFAIVLQDGDVWQAGWNSRAQMYAQSIKTPYWRGAVKLLALPAMPGDGTSQCLTNCRCAWDIVQLEGDGNYDCTWQISDVEHCQICRQRALDWAPLKVREGVVQI
jgi:hypothetical protein